MLHGICFFDVEARLANNDADLSFIVESRGEARVRVDILIGSNDAGLALRENRGVRRCTKSALILGALQV